MTQIPSRADSVNERLILIFRSGEEYVFTMGDSTMTLPVRLSSAAIGLFKSHGMGADDLAHLAAQWALRRNMTSVDLALSNEHFTELYLAISPDLEDGLRQAA
jgi:hypothetical protein